MYEEKKVLARTEQQQNTKYLDTRKPIKYGLKGGHTRQKTGMAPRRWDTYLFIVLDTLLAIFLETQKHLQPKQQADGK